MIAESLPERATAALSIRLFGAFDARLDGSPLPTTRSRKEQWLLAILVLRKGQAVDRSWLAGTLWAESPESGALGTLRRSRMDVRRVLGPQAGRLTAPGHRTISLDSTGACVDVLEFDAAV